MEIIILSKSGQCQKDKYLAYFLWKKLDSHLSPYTKVKSEWIKILNIIFEIQKLWKDNVEKP